MTAPRALLADIVDYAGLFPPAALDMTEAVSNYARYREGDASWMLGRFVVPVARFGEMRETWIAEGATPAVLKVAGLLGTDALSDMDRVHRFNAMYPSQIVVDCVEGKFTSADAIRTASARAGGLELFAEIPRDEDPETLIAAIAGAGASAKIRTGGVTPETFPAAGTIVRFIRRCVEAGVRLKATAGLHHPLSADYRLTYEDGAACSSMFGFLNVFLAAAAIRAGADDADVMRLLNERHASAFTWSPDVVSWEGTVFTASDLTSLRDRVAVSFGSCSFREPVDESRALGLIA